MIMVSAKDIQALDIPHGVRFSTMTLNMFSGLPDSFAYLKGKAAEIRHFGKPLLHIFCEHMDSSDATHRHIKLGLQLSCRIEDLLEEHKDLYVFPKHAAQEMVDACFNFTQCVTVLANHYQVNANVEKALFNFTIQFHYLMHIGLMSAFANPRRQWCYAGEQMMEKGKQLLQGCVRGTRPPVVIPKAMRKYAIGLAFVLRDYKQ